MAAIDYGTILVRDGIIQNRDRMFMKKTDLGCDIPDKFGGQFTLYTASGTVGSNAELVTIEIPCDIWEKVTSGDEINYKQRAVGKPYDIKIAE